jgi:hypothetical protein
MTHRPLTTMAIAAGIAFGTVASADGMSKTEFDAAQSGIDTE